MQISPPFFLGIAVSGLAVRFPGLAQLGARGAAGSRITIYGQVSPRIGIRLFGIILCTGLLCPASPSFLFLSEFNTEADFVQWLLDVYDKVITCDMAPLTAGQQVINTGLAYFRHTDHTPPQVCIVRCYKKPQVNFVKRIPY